MARRKPTYNDCIKAKFALHRPNRPGADIATKLQNPPVNLERTGSVATITLNRPDSGNRIDAEMAVARANLAWLAERNPDAMA